MGSGALKDGKRMRKRNARQPTQLREGSGPVRGETAGLLRGLKVDCFGTFAAPVGLGVEGDAGALHQAGHA